MADPTFPKRDPADPDFWELRYAARFAPWDAGKVPARLLSFVEASPPQHVLVPGCGSAWDVRCFAEHGWDVLGIDFSRLAVEEARRILGPHAQRVREADFFAPTAGAPFDVVYEDFAGRYEDTIRDILRHLGLPEADTIAIAEATRRKQSDGLSRRWAERYKAESGRFAHA